jgi:hypothetical protein
MQFRRFGDAVHLTGASQLMWDRVSFSRLTVIYFFFSIAHFIIQLSLQIKAFTINADAAHFLTSIVDEAQTTNNSLPSLHGSVLRMCSWVPSNLNLDIPSCPIVWNGSVTGNDTLGGNTIDFSGNGNTASVIYSISSTPSATTSSTSSTVATASSSFVSSVSSVSSIPTSSSISYPVDENEYASSNLATTSSSTAPARLTHTVTVFVVPQATSAIDDSRTSAGLSSDDGDVNGDSTSDTDDAVDDEVPILFHNIRRDVQIIPSRNANSVQVTLIGLDGDKNSVLDNSCLWSLNWPVSVLGNTKREDLVFIGFQVWVLGMSLVALLNESIPHILASLLTHVLATGWTVFQIFHTAHFHSDFNRVITHGACNGISLLPNYWEARSRAEIPSLVMNVIALLISCFLTWKLIKLFGWQTFKRVGASLTINRIYKLVLILSITIQLSLFFMIVTVSLWVDQLMNSVIGDLASFQKLYKVTSFITLALLIPWLMTGWFAVRRELRLPMFIFLMLSILYLAGWGVMFFSTTFRWTFVNWMFFSIMATASVFLTLLSVVLGVICRFNFGKGLARYLNAQQPLEDVPPSYEGSDIEKVAFPSSEKPLPTYASFNDYDEGFPPSFHSGSTLGPRFSNKSAEPFETSAGIPFPAPVLSRKLNDVQVHRSDSYGSARSHGSNDSQLSHARTDSSNSHGNHKRWVIE